MSKRRKVGRPKNIICILCNKKINKDDAKTIIAIDRPVYLNIPVHLECFEKMDEKELEKAVIQHIESIL